MKNEIKKCVTVLKEGGTLLYPTDTIWGIGCDATNEEAVDQVYGIKDRPQNKSMIILVSGTAMAERYVSDAPEIAWELMELTNTPLTLIFPVSKMLANNVTAYDGSIGIRIPMDDFCLELVRQFGKPLVSSSANLSGDPSPGSYSDISEQIKSKVDYIADWKRDVQTSGKASSIIKLEADHSIHIIRE